MIALVGLVYLDRAQLAGGLATLVRTMLVAAPILVSLGFFLSVASPRATQPP